MSEFKGKKILITGATGFIGGRLVERLIEDEGAEVVALVRNFARAPRLARYKVRMVAGDVLDPEAVKDAMRGCDYVVHCAVSFAGSLKERSRITVEGTRNLCEAAAEFGVKGFVHMGTFSTYGDAPDGALTEASRKNPKWPYGKAKLLADRVVEEAAAKGLPAVILEPTIVYGPWSFWSTYPEAQTTRGRAVLPRAGEGLCNPVYIDDVVAAILRGLRAEGGRGKRYLITGNEPVTWKEFFEAHLGGDATSSLKLLSTEEVSKLLFREKWVKPFQTIVGRIRGDRVLRTEILSLPGIREASGLVLKILPALQDRLMGRKPGQKKIKRPSQGPIPLPDNLPNPEHFEFLRSRVEIRNERAKRELGFEPEWDLAQGAAMSRKWLEWANIIEEKQPAGDV